jgi:hypothetical protein
MPMPATPSTGAEPVPPASPAAAPSVPVPTLDDLPAAIQQAAGELAAKTSDVRRIAFDYTSTQADEGGPGSGPAMPAPSGGRVEAVPPERLRLEGKGMMEGQEVELLMVMNGPKTWMEIRDPATGEATQVVKIDFSALPGGEVSQSGPLPGGSLKADDSLPPLAGEARFESVGKAEVNREPCTVFEGTRAEGGTVKAFFSTEDGLMRRLVRTDAQGNVVEEMTISNIEVNPALPASRFDYTPPPGVPVMDFGEIMKQMMEGFGKAMEGMGQDMGEMNMEGFEEGFGEEPE